ncbi:hypothetical protein RI543_005177 [Arxiozyma heterogenica]|uniref:Mif2/CENP-C cupin domain-containing protein n=1 Tax=Arxiozyma heterogenica TaxID=278026 RepID=A0AAN7WRI3_9SACH|nr:hypothetical protein RI543_005177 [Kazachstania heterogenica]
MDYMNLGIKSRKTGISVKDDIDKDEFDMENMDDFFKDSVYAKSTPSSTGKRSSILSPSARNYRRLSTTRSNNNSSNGKHKNKFAYLSSPHIMSPSINRTPINRTNTLFNTSILQSIQEEQKDRLTNRNHLYLNARKKQKLNDFKDDSSFRLSNYKTTYNLDITPSITTINITNDNPIKSYNDFPNTPLISPQDIPDNYDTVDVSTQQQLNQTRRHVQNNNKKNNVSWLDYNSNPYIEINDDRTEERKEKKEDASVSLPDLTNNDELTLDNTSLATSNDAILESEISSSESNISSDDEDQNNNNVQTELEYNNTFDVDIDATYIPSSPTGTNNFHETNIDQESSNTTTLRKSNRIKIPTLDYWRNEKIVYKRKNDNPSLDIVKIITYDDNNRPINSPHDSNTNETNYLDDTTEFELDENTTPDMSKGQYSREKNMKLRRGMVKDTRNGSWLRDGELNANIFTSKQLNNTTNETVAYGPGIYQMEKVKQNDTEKYSLAVTFDKHKDLFASGMLKIPINGKRNMTSSQNAFITFYMIRGILEVTLNKQRFIVTSGCTFQIPAFNKYSFNNKGGNEVQMFFVQVIVSEDFDQLPQNKNLKYNSSSSTRSIRQSSSLSISSSVEP